MIVEIKVNNRYELLECVQAHVRSPFIRRIFNELTAEQIQKLLLEVCKRKYYSIELEGLIHHMFVK